MNRDLTDEEFVQEVCGFERTAFRLELQLLYRESSEQATLARFLAGDPEPPTQVPGLAAWFAYIAGLAETGRTMQRVRVHEDPPTPYQRWERWIGAWNVAAGEDIRYLTRHDAHRIGLLPAAGEVDWWLLDSNRVLTMTFDTDGTRLRNELTTDPEVVAQACTWRDLAVRHTSRDVPPSTARS